MKSLCTAAALCVAGTLASADSISFASLSTNGNMFANLTFQAGVGPQRSMNLRLFDTVLESQGLVIDAGSAIDGDLSTFARVGGTGNDAAGANLDLGFANPGSINFTKSDVIVFNELGQIDTPIYVEVDINGIVFEIDNAAIAAAGNGVDMTVVAAGPFQKTRILELDLSGSFFASLPNGQFDSFRISNGDMSQQSGLSSPDISFGGLVVVPLPPASLAALGLLVPVGAARVLRRR